MLLNGGAKNGHRCIGLEAHISSDSLKLRFELFVEGEVGVCGRRWGGHGGTGGNLSGLSPAFMVPVAATGGDGHMGEHMGRASVTAHHVDMKQARRPPVAARNIHWTTAEVDGRRDAKAQCGPVVIAEYCYLILEASAKQCSTTSSDVRQWPPGYNGGHWWPPANFPPPGISLGFVGQRKRHPPEEAETQPYRVGWVWDP
ncbi:hypothetical protein C8R47DRAFT_1252056 [Mycena vitilis]|nr:hypothetical protein C8R47DRAFT_1252056 [Mycena vitilis]